MQVPMLEVRGRRVLPEERPSEGEPYSGPVRLPKIGVFLVIENRLLRDALTHLLCRRGEFKLIGKGDRCETSAADVAKSSCDVTLLDFVDPDWISQATEQHGEMGTATKIVAVGREAECPALLAAVRCGVNGYLLNDASADDVLTALRAVARGEVYCPPQLCTMLFQTVAQMEPEKERKGSRGVRLTPRQHILMNLVAKGLTNKEIAGELFLSVYTVKNHMSRILKRMNAESRSEAVGTLRAFGARRVREAREPSSWKEGLPFASQRQ